MATLIGVYRQQQIDGVSPTNTSIEIGEIRIERNLQPRRKLTRTYTETDVLEMEVDVCCFAGCDEAATTEAVYVPAGEKRRLCEKHVGLLTGECSSNDWRFY
jgi:hypothetical protein